MHSQSSQVRREKENERDEQASDTFNAGWTAGVISKTTVLPLDLIKRRHQVTQLQPMGQHTTRQSMSLLQTARHIIRHEGGVRALYRGATPAVLKTATASAIAFASYELILRLSTPD